MRRDGHTHCRCPYCNLTPLSLVHLHQYINIHDKNPKADTKGVVVMKPQILIEPQYYIIPLLHLMIGIANNSWWSMYYFFDEFVGFLLL